MRISLEIKEDSELRDAVREAVMGEIAGWAREEIQKIFIEVVTKKVESKTASDEMVKRAIWDEMNRQIKVAVSNTITRNWTFTSQEDAKEEVRKIVIQILSEWVLDSVKEPPKGNGVEGWSM